MRQRPVVHFTARQGWTNDPHGIINFGGRYHMFFQYNPSGTVWDKACHWGHAVSSDLITWDELPVALYPEDEVGCWSGSAVVTGDEVTILYTTIRHDDLGRGAVALARSSGDLIEWTRVAGPDVIDGPPENLDIVAFRDPYVWKSGTGWRAILGAGLVGHGGTALQYSSPDLKAWSFDGLVAKRANSDHEPVWTGKVWECPQLIQVGDRWLLTVSVWDDDVLHYVAYALGDYDGSEFHPQRWGRFSHGPIAYASSIFRDSEGQPTAMSWLREQNNRTPDGSPWASAMSLPFELSVEGDELRVRHHANLAACLPLVSSAESGEVDVVGPTFFRTSGLISDTTVRVASSTVDWTLHVGNRTLWIESGVGERLLEMPAIGDVATSELSVSIDADIVEVTWSACPGVGSIRVPIGPDRVLRWRTSAEADTALHSSRNLGRDPVER